MDKHLKKCSAIVRTWPKWKRGVLGGRIPMTGIELIAEERQRQFDKHFTKEHDAKHTEQQLLVSATGLLLMALNEADEEEISAYEFLDNYAPLRDLEWINYIVQHPRPDNIKGLVIAGALIAAEIDRLQRMAK